MFRALVHTTPPRRRAPPHTRSVSTVRVPKWIRPVPCLQRLVVIPSRSRRWRRGSAGRVVGTSTIWWTRRCADPSAEGTFASRGGGWWRNRCPGPMPTVPGNSRVGPVVPFWTWAPEEGGSSRPRLPLPPGSHVTEGRPPDVPVARRGSASRVLETAVRRVERAGLVVARAHQDRTPRRFLHVGAPAFHSRTIPWWVPRFGLAARRGTPRRPHTAMVGGAR